MSKEMNMVAHNSVLEIKYQDIVTDQHSDDKKYKYILKYVRSVYSIFRSFH